MTIGHLLDHTCVIWRKVEALGEFRESVKTFEQPFEVLPCTGTRKNTVLAQDGPGIVNVGDRRIYFDIGPEILKRDLIELLTGGDAPATLEVESVTRPRNHHIEVRVSEYNGPAPAVGS